MTNIILKIEQANDENNEFLKDNADDIVKMANALYEPKMRAEPLGADDYRDWLFKNHAELAAYLYDDLGVANKKTGERKAIMSQHKKNIAGGIKTIATDNAGFLQWAGQSEIGNEVSSLAKVTASINKFQKSLEPASNETDDGDDTDAGDDGDDTDAPLSLEDVAKALCEKYSNDEAMKLSQLIYDIACGGASDEAVEAVS
tara:strand:+ start:337 stop:939 length:603 start_codon:yes stop_codon:yes gene_type:complete